MLDQLIAIIAGIIIGFAMAVPVGPVGLIVFQRSVVKSRLMGLSTGLGAALTDGFLASIGAFGIKIIWDFIIEQQTTLRLVGGVILIVVGLVGVFAKPKVFEKKKVTAITLIEHFLSGVILTITNPVAALSFFVIFASIGPRLGIGGDGVATFLVVGVVMGSALWWLTLTSLATFLGHKIKHEHLDLMNKCFGIVIAIVGMVMLLGVFLK
jgi:arginine exporter protein ArgO